MTAADIVWVGLLAVIALMIVLHEAGRPPKYPYETRRRRK